MDWVNKQKLPTIEAIKYNNQPYLFPDSLQRALHSSFNTVLHQQVDVKVLNEIGDKLTTYWKPFSKEEFRQTINKCNNLSTLGPNKLLWHYLKFILKQDNCLSNIINIANACINLEHWPNYFKSSTMVVIPKLSSSQIVDLVSFYFTFHFYFYFVLFFYFQRNQGQGGLVMLSHQSQSDGVVTRQITRLGKIQQKI